MALQLRTQKYRPHLHPLIQKNVQQGQNSQKVFNKMCKPWPQRKAQTKPWRKVTFKVINNFMRQTKTVQGQNSQTVLSKMCKLLQKVKKIFRCNQLLPWKAQTKAPILPLLGCPQVQFTNVICVNFQSDQLNCYRTTL